MKFGLGLEWIPIRGFVSGERSGDVRQFSANTGGKVRPCVGLNLFGIRRRSVRRPTDPLPYRGPRTAYDASQGESIEFKGEKNSFNFPHPHRPIRLESFAKYADGVSVKRGRNSNQHPQQNPFEGLNTDGLQALYSLAAIRTLREGEFLIREGETDQTVYVLLQGEVRIVKDLQGQEEILATLGEGNWVGEIAFARQIPRTASAIANRPLKVMVIDKATLNAMEEKTQLFFYKRFNDLAMERISQLDQRGRDLAFRNQELIGQIFMASRQEANYGGSQLIRSILAKVPRLPLFAGTLTTKLLDERISVREVGDLVREDPALMGVVLKTVNSPYYGLRVKISDIHHAIVLIGLNELYHIVLGEGIRKTMPDTPKFQLLHAHCAAVSQVSFAISQSSGLGHPAQMATIGLLHDLGRCLILLIKQQNPALVVLIDALDHAQLGALLLREWNLPEVAWQTLAFQRYPEFSPPSKIPPEVQENVAILYLAHLCCEFYEGGQGNTSTAFLNDYRRLLKWDRYSVEDIAVRVLLPVLGKKLNSFPSSFREVLSRHLEAGGSQPGVPAGR